MDIFTWLPRQRVLCRGGIGRFVVYAYRRKYNSRVDTPTSVWDDEADVDAVGWGGLADEWKTENER